MSIAAITKPGLTAMALSVCVLWACLIGERIIVDRAAREQTAVLRDLTLLRQRLRSEPVSVPVPHYGRTRPTRG